MSVEALLQSLEESHKELEVQLEEEMTRPAPDDVKIHELKREKLRIKDKIAELTHT